ncbi:ActS/PrrB/RegB family redox-sensitive histidine kinase, partial [Thioclava sp. BHET1]
GWIRLRTLVMLRWMAIIGQIVALLVANFVFELRLAFDLCLLAIGASVLANLIAVMVSPVNKRLSETEAMLTLLFDITQLTFLLYFSGGLNNPFALLILAPVSISATALEPRTTIFLGAASVALMTVLAFFSVPLETHSGEILEIPRMLHYGFWLAIVIGTIFLGLYSRRVAVEINSMSEALFATQMALAREQKLTDLGGVVAAATHELGTPLATIKLVSTELISDLEDLPEQREDVELIRDQADRCRDILRSMGRSGKDDLHLRSAPLSAVIRDAAEPHIGRGKTVEINLQPGKNGDPRQPHILRQPEIIHGLRNLIQNAVDFAASTVWIDCEWTDRNLTLRIMDDGPGYPIQILGRIGDPFVRPRRSITDTARPEYEGMGLGLFIAKTLLERSRAELTFANGSDPARKIKNQPERRGAVVSVCWPLEAIRGPESGPLGENLPIET